MKKIGILETSIHPIYLYSTVRILKSEDTMVSIFTIKENYDIVAPILGKKLDKYFWVIKNDNETLREFLKRIKLTIEQSIDILYVNTITDGLKDILAYCCFNPAVYKTLTIHNPHLWFDWDKNIGYKAKIKHIFRKLILPKYDALIGVSEKVKKYILTVCKYQKPIYVIPFSIYEPYEASENDKYIIFAASGRIDKIRRDYHSLLNIFEVLFPKYPQVFLKILGMPDGKYGEEIVRKCLELKSKGYNIFVSQEYIKGDFFEKEMKGADILIGPINMFLYDASKETGIIYDAIRFAKPVVMPEGYDIPIEIQSSTLFFKDWDHLGQIIEKLIINKNDKLKELKQTAKKNSLFFTSEYIRKTRDIGLKGIC